MEDVGDQQVKTLWLTYTYMYLMMTPRRWQASLLSIPHAPTLPPVRQRLNPPANGLGYLIRNVQQKHPHHRLLTRGHRPRPRSRVPTSRNDRLRHGTHHFQNVRSQDPIQHDPVVAGRDVPDVHRRGRGESHHRNTRQTRLPPQQLWPRHRPTGARPGH